MLVRLCPHLRASARSERQAVANQAGPRQLHLSQLLPRAAHRLYEAAERHRPEREGREGPPADGSAEESQAVADYAAAGITLHAAGAIYFDKDDDDDIRAKFEYCKRAGVRSSSPEIPRPTTLPRVEKFVKEYDIRIAIHNHGPEDKLWQSPLDVLKAIGNMDPRIGCCIDVGHTARAGTDVVEAIHAAGPRLFNVHMKDLTDFTTRRARLR